MLKYASIFLLCLNVLAANPTLLLHLSFEDDFTDGVKVTDQSGYNAHGWNMQGTNWIIRTNGNVGSYSGYWYTNGVMTNSPPSVYPLSTYLAVTNVSHMQDLTTMSFSVWVKTLPTFQSQGATIHILSGGYPVAYAEGSTNAWSLARYFTPYFIFQIFDSTGIVNCLSFPNDTVDYEGSYDLTMTNWNHYAATFDCGNNVAIGYHNGLPFQTNTINRAALRIYGCASMRWLCVGAHAHNGGPAWMVDDGLPNDGFMHGGMDDLRIYGGVLTANNITTLYQGNDPFVSSLPAFRYRFIPSP